MSHGVGDDAGYRYTALVRPATPQEAAPLLDDEERETARLATVRRMHQLLAFGDNGVDGAVIEFPPSPAPSPEVAPLLPVRVPIGAGAGPRPEIRVDRAGGWVWTLLYAGTGAYDPQLANYRGWIAVRHPLTSERGQLLEELIAWFPGPGEPRPTRPSQPDEAPMPVLPEEPGRIMLAGPHQPEGATSHYPQQMREYLLERPWMRQRELVATPGVRPVYASGEREIWSDGRITYATWLGEGVSELTPAGEEAIQWLFRHRVRQVGQWRGLLEAERWRVVDRQQETRPYGAYGGALEIEMARGEAVVRGGDILEVWSATITLYYAMGDGDCDERGGLYPTEAEAREAVEAAIVELTEE
ncbi:hypothetical protein GCM10027294_53550 [Marinactinospora endophytica]